MVFSTYEVEWNIVKTRFENFKVPRGCQHDDHGRNFDTIWRSCMLAFVVIVLHKTHTQKVGSEQRDKRMDDKKRLELLLFADDDDSDESSDE